MIYSETLNKSCAFDSNDQSAQIVALLKGFVSSRFVFLLLPLKNGAPCRCFFFKVAWVQNLLKL